MTYTIYIDVEQMETKYKPRQETLFDIGHWFGEQGIRPKECSREIFDPCLKVVVTDKDDAFAIKMRFPMASKEQIERQHENQMARLNNTRAYLNGTIITANTIQANTIKATKILNQTYAHITSPPPPKLPSTQAHQTIMAIDPAYWQMAMIDPDEDDDEQDDQP